jgi:hypothetical protein
MGKEKEVMKLEIEKTLVVNVQHITELDTAFLHRWASDRINAPLVVDASPHWACVRIDRDEVPDLSELSPMFREFYSWAANHEEHFDAIKFDGDGPIVEAMPLKEW